MDIITSKDNAQVKEARKLLQKKYRDKEGRYLIEGSHLFEEAVKSGAQLEQIFVLENRLRELPELTPQPLVVTEQVLASLSDTETPEGLVVIVAKREVTDYPMNKLLVLENIQDPGNVGTMIRTADAAGFDAVFTSKGTADIYSPKVMRAMQGSNFHLPIISNMECSQLFEFFHEKNLEILVTTLSKNSISYKEVHFQRLALVMGNEGAGVSEFASQNADKLVHIPMPGKAESLNVAVAAGILMFAL